MLALVGTSLAFAVVIFVLAIAGLATSVSLWLTLPVFLISLVSIILLSMEVRKHKRVPRTRGYGMTQGPIGPTEPQTPKLRRVNLFTLPREQTIKSGPYVELDD